MSFDFIDSTRQTDVGVAGVLARVAAEEGRADAALVAAIDDFFLPDDTRLDDQIRAALHAVLVRMARFVEGRLVAHALAIVEGDPGRSALTAAQGRTLPRLARAGLLRDGEFMAELIGRVRLGLIARRLVPIAGKPDEASLLVRLAECPDAMVADAARALLLADSRAEADPQSTNLPAELHHRVVWWVAAGLHEACETAALDGLDHAIVDAALRTIAEHDEGDRPEAIAMRLAHAIDARPAEFGELLLAALGEGRLTLMTAIIAHATCLAFDDMRAMVADADGDRLWLILRGEGVGRGTLARIGLALAEADPRRDVDSFANQIDAIAELSPERAKAAIAPLRLHRDFRAARRALARAPA